MRFASSAVQAVGVVQAVQTASTQSVYLREVVQAASS